VLVDDDCFHSHLRGLLKLHSEARRQAGLQPSHSKQCFLAVQMLFDLAGSLLGALAVMRIRLDVLQTLLLEFRNWVLKA